MAALCLSSSLRKLERVVTRHYDSFLSETGVSAVQLPLLTSLHLEPNLTLSEQAQILQVERTTLWRNLRPLIRDRLVIEHNDRRPARYELSRRGLARLEVATERWTAAHEQIQQMLGSTLNGLQLDIRKASELLRQATEDSPNS